jgi:hypothetical protein
VSADADDAHVPDSSIDHVLWLDFVDIDTGETTTIDVADAPTAGNGETIVFSWGASGFLSGVAKYRNER